MHALGGQKGGHPCKLSANGGATNYQRRRARDAGGVDAGRDGLGGGGGPLVWVLRTPEARQMGLGPVAQI